MKHRLLILSALTALLSSACNGNDDITPQNNYPNIASICAAGTGFFETDALVGAVGKEAFIIVDDTGAMLVYSVPTGIKEGDKIHVSGNISKYKTGYTTEFDSDSRYTVVSNGNPVSHNPTSLTSGTANSWVGNLEGFTRVREVDVVGTLQFKAGKVSKYDYANIIISGATAQASLKYVDNSQYANADGLQIHVKGYAVAISGGKYIDILPYEVNY